MCAGRLERPCGGWPVSARLHACMRGVACVPHPPTLRLRCSTPSGKRSVGSVVSHSLKSGCGLLIFSRIFSRVLSHLGSRWQFCRRKGGRKTHK